MRRKSDDSEEFPPSKISLHIIKGSLSFVKVSISIKRAWHLPGDENDGLMACHLLLYSRKGNAKERKKERAERGRKGDAAAALVTAVVATDKRGGW